VNDDLKAMVRAIYNQPLTVADLEAAYEVRVLDAMLMGDVKCESPHCCTVCSLEVVAVNTASCESIDLMVCQSVVDWVAELKAIYAVCNCGVSTADCWKIIPI
jgi:hypothetical protein